MKLIKLLAAGAALFLAVSTQATVIVSLQPASQTINAGDSVSLELVISGLGDQVSPSLAGFAFDINYDPAVLSAVSAAFGSELDLGILGSIQFADLSTPGVVHVDEVSFESSSDLNASQPGSFTLATLGFTGVGPGSSALSLTGGSLSDEAAASLVFDTASALVEVTGTVAVSDAGWTVALMPLGMLGLLLWRRQGRACA